VKAQCTVSEQYRSVHNDTSTAVQSVTLSHSKPASHSSRLYTVASSSEQTHSRPATLSIDEKQATCRLLHTVVVTSCTAIQGKSPRAAHSSYAVRSNNVQPPRFTTSISQSSARTNVVTSVRSPSNRTNSGSGRYSDNSGSNTSCATNGR